MPATPLVRMMRLARRPPRVRLAPVDVRHLRRRFQCTQHQFCRRFGFNLATLRHWERGDRRPSGAALVLLNVVRHNPAAVLKALSNTRFRERHGAPRWSSPRGVMGRPRGEDKRGRWRLADF